MRDHTYVMDLTNYYRDFVVDDCEFSFHCVRGTVPSYLDEDGNLHCAVAAFQHPDADLARDPLSANHRSTEETPLAMFGTLIVAGSSRDHIRVLIPDTVGTMVNADSPLGLQHVVGLRLGTPMDLRFEFFTSGDWVGPGTVCQLSDAMSDSETYGLLVRDQPYSR